MDFKKKVLGYLFRLLRLVGGLAVIYVSMVFYMCLTERRNAFPRAITHEEANAYIKDKAQPVSCKTEDGLELKGFRMGNGEGPAILYFADANEDVAQFLAEVDQSAKMQVIAYNYRGSGSNSGSPSEKTFERDADYIHLCATKELGRRPEYLAGRGTGAILAAEQFVENERLLMIDPVASIADAIAAKYRLLHPKFLVRTDVKIPQEKLKSKAHAVKILFDRKSERDMAHNVALENPSVPTLERAEKTLQNFMEGCLD